MLNGLIVDDGTPVTAEELKAIGLRAQQTRMGVNRDGPYIHFGTGDGLEQCLADRARLLRAYAGAVGAHTLLSETPLPKGLVGVNGEFVTRAAAEAAANGYEERWPPMAYGTALRVKLNINGGFTVEGSRAAGE